jgi:hypothetical protein
MPDKFGWCCVDRRQHSALERRPVTHELAKLSKGPLVQIVAWRPSGVNRLADVREVFDRIRAAAAFGVRCNLLGDARIDVLSKAGPFPLSFFRRRLTPLLP